MARLDFKFEGKHLKDTLVWDINNVSDSIETLAKLWAKEMQLETKVQAAPGKVCPTLVGKRTV
eukprot:scaffold3170_cov56-Prasinocladus_malaysianus.AAC.1